MKNNNIEPRPGGVISYVLENGVGTWYYAEIQKWIMTDWGQFGIDMSKESCEVVTDFLHNILSEDKVEINQIKETIDALWADGKDLQAAFFLPMIFVDVANRQLYSNYYDVSIERFVLAGWEGKYEEVKGRIPMDQRFWDNDST
jgi:hypothetical protein